MSLRSSFNIVLFTGLLSIQTLGATDKKIIEQFEVNWESIRYNKSVSLYNPKVSPNERTSSESETMTLNCQIEIREPNLTIGTCGYGIITEIKDNKGRDIEHSQDTSTSGISRRMSYQGLSYRQRYTRPPQPSRWNSLIRRIFRIPTPTFTPQLVDELQPSDLNIELDIGMLESAGVKTFDIKGYFYALTAQSIEYINIPFEPNNTWISLVDNLEIRVNEAQNILSASRLRYRYEIEERDSRGPRNRLGNSLVVEDLLPERIVVNRQFIKQDGELINRIPILRLPFNAGGGGSGSHSGSRGVSPIEKIRFIIAVNPAHQKIPFEIKKIPLPNPDSD